MSLELRDQRLKITVETDCVVQGIARNTGRDRCEILREVLHEWAMGKIHEFNLIQQYLESEGIAGHVRDKP